MVINRLLQDDYLTNGNYRLHLCRKLSAKWIQFILIGLPRRKQPNTSSSRCEASSTSSRTVCCKPTKSEGVCCSTSRKLMHAWGRVVRRSIRLTPMNDCDALAWLASGAFNHGLHSRITLWNGRPNKVPRLWQTVLAEQRQAYTLLLFRVWRSRSKP